MRLFSMLVVPAVACLLTACKPPQKMSASGEVAPESTSKRGGDLAGTWESPPGIDPAVAVQLPPAPPRSDAKMLEQHAGKSIGEILAATAADAWPGDVALVDGELVDDVSNAPGIKGSTLFTFQAGAILPQQLDKAVFADFNADGNLDVVAFAADGSPLRLLVQVKQGKGVKFDRKADAGLDAAVGGHALRPVDFDGDGRTDLMILRGDGRPNSLLHNTAGEGFVDVTVDRGLLDFRSAVDVVWADFDADGALDVLVVNDGANQYCALYMAQADGRFIDRAHVWGLRARGKGLTSAALLDIDSDGWLDVVLSGGDPGKGTPVGCYRNLAGKSFERLDLPREMSGASILVADFDEDGREDLLSLDGDAWHWWRNSGESSEKALAPFADVSEFAGLSETGLSGRSKPLIADVDGDGDLDLLDNDGARLLLNRRGDRFIDSARVGQRLGLGDAEIKILAIDDFDGDGDQDAFCTAGILLGTASANSEWVRLKAGPEMVGAKISLSVRDAGWVQSTVHRRIGVSGDLSLTIGLGDAETITGIELLHPGGTTVRVDAAGPLRGVIRLGGTSPSSAVK